MPVDPMFWLATAAFAWGLSLASYRWFAIYNGWPMGEWQAHRPGLPIAIGLVAIVFAVFFAMARGGETALVLPLFGAVCALAWTAVMRVAAQIALLLAPLAVLALLGVWISAASRIAVTGIGDPSGYGDARAASRRPPAATERDTPTNNRDRSISTGDAGLADRDRGITRPVPRALAPSQ